MALATGARKSSILELPWDCVEFHDDKTVVRVKAKKGGKPVVVPFYDEAARELCRLYAWYKALERQESPISGSTTYSLRPLSRRSGLHSDPDSRCSRSHQCIDGCPVHGQ